MNFFDYINFDKQGIYDSILIILITMISFYTFYKLKPSFVLPSKKINKPKKFFVNLITYFIVILLVIIPLNLSLILGKKIETEKTLNVQILFDVSLSMTANDISPSRFTSAKSSVIDLVNNLTWYNISVITFSWIPFIRSPFSSSTSAISAKLNNMSLWEFPPTINFVWTAIWDALMLWLDNLKKISSDGKKPGLIVLITDWDSNKWSDPLQAAWVAADSQIPIYTLGIWKNNYVVWYDHYGSPVTTDINIDLLENIASTTDAKFYRVLSAEDFKWIFDEISKYVKSSDIKKVSYEYFYLNQIFYFLLILLVSSLVAIKLYNIYFYNRK